MMVFLVECGRPRLSDNLGLFEEQDTNFQFKIRDYVFGTTWPKPQEEKKTSTLLTIDPDNFE